MPATHAEAPPSEQLPMQLRNSPGFLLGKAAQLAADFADAALQPLDLKARHYGALVTLEAHGPLTQQALGSLLRIDRTSMVAVIDHLEHKNLVERVANRTDRRANLVRLTQAGDAALRQAQRAMGQADGALMRRLSMPEQGRLVSVLRKLIEVHL